jgi:hypothetical protein
MKKITNKKYQTSFILLGIKGNVAGKLLEDIIKQKGIIYTHYLLSEETLSDSDSLGFVALDASLEVRDGLYPDLKKKLIEKFKKDNKLK